MELKDFLATYSTYRDIEQSTIEQYRYVLDCFSRHLGRPARLSDLQPGLVNSWLASLKSTHSPHTVHSRRNTILSIWHVATELDVAEAAKMVRRVKVPKHVVTRLTTQEIERIFAAAERLRGVYNGYRWNDMVRTWIQATLETAMRPGDMRSLELIDVLSHRGKLTIIQQKTGVVRRVLLSPRLLRDIGSWHGPSGLVWPLGDKQIMARKLTLVGRLADVKLTHTQLRKTAITDVESQLPGAGWRFAGHATPATTQQWYIDWDAADGDLPRPNF